MASRLNLAPSCFCIKFSWNTATSTYLHIVYGCFSPTKIYLSSCNGDHMALKAQNIYSLVLYMKSFSTLALEQQSSTPEPYTSTVQLVRNRASQQEVSSRWAKFHLYYSFSPSPWLTSPPELHLLWSQQQCYFLTKKESEVAQSRPTLCSPIDSSPPASSIHGIFQARILEWVAISFSRRSAQPRDWTRSPVL